MLNFFSVILFTVLPVFADTTPKIKVLVVEELESARKDTVEIMKKLDYLVTSAGNTEQALAVWESFQPDVVILDLDLPLADGGESSPINGMRLVEAAPKDNSKVILYSGNPPPKLWKDQWIDYDLKGTISFKDPKHSNLVKNLIDFANSGSNLPKRLQKHKGPEATSAGFEKGMKYQKMKSQKNQNLPTKPIEPRPEPAKAQTVNPSSKIKVLVVEGLESSRKDTVEKMKEWGYQVKSAGDAKQAVSIWKFFQPHVVILEMHLPLQPGDKPLIGGGFKILKTAPRDKAKVVLYDGIQLPKEFIEEWIDFDSKGKIKLSDSSALKKFIDSSINNGLTKRCMTLFKNKL